MADAFRTSTQSKHGSSRAANLWLASTLPLCLLLAACHITHISPDRPALPAPPPLPPTPQSTVSLNIQASLAGVGPALDSAIPSRYDTATYCQAMGLLCARGSIAPEPVLFSLSGDRVSMLSWLYYQLDINIGGADCSCGRPDNPKRRAGVKFDGTLAWTPDWTLSLEQSRANASALDACKVCIFNRDITGDVMKVLNNVVSGLPATADSKLRQISDLRTQADKAWQSIQQPFPAGDLWVSLHPGQVIVSPIAGQGEVARATVGMILQPEIISGSQPPDPGLPLPNLTVGAPPSDFHLVPQISISFGSVQSALAMRLVGKTFELKRPPFPKLKVEISGVQVLASGDEVLVGLDLKGSVVGTAWLKGTVAYDSNARTLTFRAVDYDIQTRNVLLKGAAWLMPKLLDEAVLPAVHDYSYNLGADLDTLQTTLQTALNRQITSDVALSTQLSGIDVAGPSSDGTRFIFAADVSGRSDLTVKALGAPLPTGKEIRLVELWFVTTTDDKDAEEDVMAWVDLGNVGGHPVAGRTLGHLERWGDAESEGPYYFRLNGMPEVSDCHAISLHIRKNPVGSSTGKGWVMRMNAFRHLSDGTRKAATHSADDQWGDGDDYDRRFFPLCDEP